MEALSGERAVGDPAKVRSEAGGAVVKQSDLACLNLYKKTNQNPK